MSANPSSVSGVCFMHACMHGYVHACTDTAVYTHTTGQKYRRDLPLASMSHTTHFETCGGVFHKEGCPASATHVGFSKPLPVMHTSLSTCIYVQKQHCTCIHACVRAHPCVDAVVQCSCIEFESCVQVSSSNARELEQEMDSWQGDFMTNIEFPVVNGTIITTGNLQDITELGLEYMNITGSTRLQGDVVLGTSQPYPVRPGSVQQAADDVLALYILKEAQRGKIGTSRTNPLEGGAGGDACYELGLSVCDDAWQVAQAHPTAKVPMQGNPLLREIESFQMTQYGAKTLYPIGGETPARRAARMDANEWPVTPIQLSGPGGYLGGDIVFASDAERALANSKADLLTSSSPTGSPVESVPSWYEVTFNPAAVFNASDGTLCTANHCSCTDWGAPMSAHPAGTGAAGGGGDCECGCELHAMKSTTLSFAPALEANTLIFPDATGTVITTGNIEDIDGNIGLRGLDQFVVRHTRQRLNHAIDSPEASRLHGEDTDNPYTIIDLSRHGSREDVSLGIAALPLPPGSGKGRLPANSERPRGLWYVADLGPAGVYGDGDDQVYYLEHMSLEPRGGGGFRPITGWTVPCTMSAGSYTALCDGRTPEDTQWWAPRDVSFSGWEEYDRRLKGASTLEGVFPPPALGVPPENLYTVDEDGNSDGCPAAWDQTAFIARSTVRFPRTPGENRSWDEVADTWEPRFEKCEFILSGAGSPEVNGRYRSADAKTPTPRSPQPLSPILDLPHKCRLTTVIAGTPALTTTLGDIARREATSTYSAGDL